jgi:hypothetical protein
VLLLLLLLLLLAALASAGALTRSLSSSSRGLLQVLLVPLLVTGAALVLSSLHLHSPSSSVSWQGKPRVSTASGHPASAWMLMRWL